MMWKMKQIRKKLKVIVYYLPSGCYDKKDKGYFFIRCNKNKKEIYVEKNSNKIDMTLNELLNEVREELEKEIGNE